MNIILFRECLQRTADSFQDDGKKEYDHLLAEAVKLGRQHETKAKYFIPKMYDVLVRKEGLTPFDAADRIYRDVLGIWQKDTIRRLLPPEAKDQAARERQALSRLHMSAGGAGLILRKEAEASALEVSSNHHQHEVNGDNGSRTDQKLEQENTMLRKELQETKNAKSLLLERLLRMERSLAEQQKLEREKQQNREPGVQGAKDAGIVTILLPPSLFMKTYALLRSSSKPLLLRVKAGEAIDIDKTSKPN
jgi:hypothetical protein